jgi:hypothetical protein
MIRPRGKHVGLAEQAAFACGARAVEWRQGSLHLRITITLPSGRTITRGRQDETQAVTDSGATSDTSSPGLRCRSAAAVVAG